MTENENQQLNNKADGSNNVISDLEVLSKKYGLSFDSSKYKSAVSSTADHYEPAQVTDSTAPARPYTPPKNNTPAAIPKIVYDHSSSAPQLRIVYGNEAAGPEGRRVIYAEQEGETIAEKRKRVREAQKSEKGAQGFGSQPQVRHVASSDTAIARDDGEKFARTYRDSKLTGETNKQNGATVAQPPKTNGRLVATGTAAKVKHQHYEPSAGEKFAGFFKAFLPWKGDSAKEVFRKIIMDISAIAVIICFGYFVDNYVQHRNKLETDKAIGEMQTDVKTDDEEALWAKIKAEFPDVVFPEGMNIKYARHYAINQDMVGWLRIPNTNIDNPVTQCVDDKNKDPSTDNFYLKHDFYKAENKYGNPFLDPYNNSKELDKNNVIYGHNMTDGLSFAQLEKYYTIEGFRESPVIKYSTLYKDYYFKVYAAIITNGYHSGDNGYLFDYTVPTFTGEKNYSEFIQAIDERKLYDTGVDITADDKLITLSTCSYEIKENQMGRLAVIGRLVREGESTAVDTSKATVNENVRYPQIWYDEHGISNPFRYAKQWIPE